MRRLSLSAVLVVALVASAGCARSPARGVVAARSGPEPPPDRSAKAAIAFAEAQVGKRYCWGGTGPSCFDCSGLVQTAWKQGGVRLPRTSADQGKSLTVVPLDDARPGDIFWWSRGHVGLYVGRGELVDAYDSASGVVRRRATLPDRVLRVE